jgi:ribose 1,5-bisphosphate isomerase
MIKVKDIEFHSADHVLQEIEDMNVKGGSPFGRAAAWAFKLICQKEELKSYKDFSKRIIEVNDKLIAYKPTMATIHNTCNIVLNLIEGKNKNADLEQTKNDIVEVCDRIIKHSYDAIDQLSVYGANRIEDGDIIMMHSYSSTLMGMFIQAKKAGKNFSMICTESRPLRESRNAIKIFQELNIPVTLITDASAYEFLPMCDYVLMGADSLDVDGSVANKMGTAQVAKLAKACKKDVYIASELYKLDKRTQEGYEIKLERRTANEIVVEGDYDTMDGIEVINQFFDITPAIDIKAIICEYGVINPAQMVTFWNELEEKIIEG